MVCPDHRQSDGRPNALARAVTRPFMSRTYIHCWYRLVNKSNYMSLFSSRYFVSRTKPPQQV
jgi:hypothetical protein